MSKLWQQNQSTNQSISEKVEAFTVGNDHLYDQHLVPYDLKASKAHAGGLHAIGLLSDEEFQNIGKTLEQIQEQWDAGDFVVERGHEDCHTAIEEFLIKTLGDTGKKIHTGRSRNDQVLTALRLFQKDQLLEIQEITRALATSYLDFAEKYHSVPMPGYTHTQPAMLTSVGMWSANFAELLIMDMEQLKSAFKNTDHSPLGTAAGFGVNLPLPREQTSDEMGFSEVLINPIAAQNSRSKIDLHILQSLGSIGDTLAKFASDLILFSSNSFRFFTVDDALCTGSSIMPQKKNLDTAELLRAKSAEIHGFELTVRNVGRNLISGYHRDLQISKKYVMDGIFLIKELLEIARLLLNGLSPNTEELTKQCTPEIFAVDQANELVKNGMPFRDAYFKVKHELHELAVPDIEKALQAKSHLGGTGNPGIDQLRERLS